MILRLCSMLFFLSLVMLPNLSFSAPGRDPGYIACQPEDVDACSGGSDRHIKVNLQTACMCLFPGGSNEAPNCFKIDMGNAGPEMTTNGVGRLHAARGATYQTKATSDTERYDNDAIAMGIPNNDVVGKWLHKTRDCKAAGRHLTLGCIGVPCAQWGNLKEFLGEAGRGNGDRIGAELVVCGGGAPGRISRHATPIDHSADKEPLRVDPGYGDTEAQPAVETRDEEVAE